MRLIFDAYPLLNTNYTGIPQATWHLLRKFLAAEVDCLYTFGYRVLSAQEIESLVQSRSGKAWRERFIGRVGSLGQRYLGANDLKERLYFSPHVMSLITHRGLGSTRFIHDISSLTMPQFHPESTIKFDAKNLGIDIALSDRIFTVSNSSKAELVSYLGVPADKIVVAYPGIEWDADQVAHAEKLIFDRPYVLILATREPRKNLKLVLKYLVANKNRILSSDTIYLFAGPPGWGNDETEKLLANELVGLTTAGKVLFLGFVPEPYKLGLILDASYVIFPSFFEGFGSPVAEALSLGTPVACSFGGSLPEVGDNTAYFFNPESLNSLTQAISRLEFDLTQQDHAVRQRAAVQGARFTWQSCADIVLDNMRQIYEMKCQ